MAIPTFREEEERIRRERIERETKRRIGELSTRGQPGAGDVRLFQRKAERVAQQGEREVIAGTVEQERDEAGRILQQLGPLIGKDPVQLFASISDSIDRNDIQATSKIVDDIIAAANPVALAAAGIRDPAPVRQAVERLAEIVTTSMQSGIGRPPSLTGLGPAAPGGSSVPIVAPSEAASRGILAPQDTALRERAAGGQPVFLGRGTETFRLGPETGAPTSADVAARESRLASLAPGGAIATEAGATPGPFVGRAVAGGVEAAGAVPGAIGRGLDVAGEAITGVARPAAEGLMSRAGEVGETLGGLVQQAQEFTRDLLSQGFSLGEVVDFLRQRFPGLREEGAPAEPPVPAERFIEGPSRFGPAQGSSVEEVRDFLRRKFPGVTEELPSEASPPFIGGPKGPEFLTRRGSARVARIGGTPLRFGPQGTEGILTRRGTERFGRRGLLPLR